MLDGNVSLTIYDYTDQSYVERNGKRMVQENCWYTAQNSTLAEKVMGRAETKMKPVDSESRDMLHSFSATSGPVGPGIQSPLPLIMNTVVAAQQLVASDALEDLFSAYEQRNGRLLTTNQRLGMPVYRVVKK